MLNKKQIMMKISEVQKKLLDDHYPNGYDVPEGELGYYHIMFVDIINNKGGWSHGKAVFQKYFPKEWKAMLKVIENPSYGMIVTGHNEFAVIHDPVEYAAERKAAEAEKAKKAEAVKKMQEGRKRAAEAKKAKEVKSDASPQSDT